MAEDEKVTPPKLEFDPSGFPADTLFYERREVWDRRDLPAPAEPAEPVARPQFAPGERRARKDRRKRIDPTTFEKQYTDDELEFMNAMQRFKDRSGQQFPSHGEVLSVAFSLGYRKVDAADAMPPFDDEPSDSAEIEPAFSDH